MFNKILLGTVIAFVSSLAMLLTIWQYQRRTLAWEPVSIEIASSEIAHFRERRFGRVWTATVNYSHNGTSYTKTMHDLPFNASQIYVNPDDPNIAVGEQGPTIRVLFVPIIAVSATGLFGLVLLLIKFSPTDD